MWATPRADLASEELVVCNYPILRSWWVNIRIREARLVSKILDDLEL